MLTRCEFIGINSSGETVIGHKYAKDGNDLLTFLEANNIKERVVLIGGYFPDDLILPYSIVKHLMDMFPRNKTKGMQAVGIVNELALGGYFDTF